MTVSDLSKDSNGNTFGHTFSLKSLSAGTGTLTVTLIHEPTKPNDGNLSTAGGATDIAASFSSYRVKNFLMRATNQTGSFH